MARERRVSSAGLRQSGACPCRRCGVIGWSSTASAGDVPNKHRVMVAADHEVHWGVVCTVMGLATRGIIMIESCKVMEPTENQIPVAWNG